MAVPHLSASNITLPDSSGPGGGQVAAPVALKTWVNLYYPGISQYMLDPGIYAVMQKAKNGGWDQATTVAAIKDTPLYKSMLGPSTPSSSGGGGRGGGGGGGGQTAQQKEEQILAAAAAIKDQADTLGLVLDDSQIHGIANTVVASNWSAAQLTDYLTNGIADKVGTSQLRSGTMTAGIETIKKMASDQLLNISDATAREYAARLVSGNLDEAGLTSLFAEQAKGFYSWAAPQIDKGMTLRNFLMPSRDFLANELEVPPETINLMDPKYMSMVQTTTDKGEIRAATMSELQRSARQDVMFTKTKKARESAAGAALTLRRVMEGN